MRENQEPESNYECQKEMSAEAIMSQLIIIHQQSSLWSTAPPTDPPLLIAPPSYGPNGGQNPPAGLNARTLALKEHRLPARSLLAGLEVQNESES